MNIKKFLPPEEEPKNAAYHFKDSVMEHVENSNLFNTYLKNNVFKKEFTGTLWAEGPCYIPQRWRLVGEC